MDQFIKELNQRIEAGVNVSELARKSGVTRAYIYRIANREQTPTISVAERIAANLGLEFRLVDVS